MSIYEDPDAVAQLADMDMYDEMVRREEIEALVRAIGDLPDPLTRRILLKIVELSA
jgi:hypothetical protein